MMVIGLDCAAPHLVFSRYRDRMPNIAALCATGTYGPMRSTVPPITVPAWTSMVTGYDPGELGLYGFRNRKPRSYGLELVTSQHIEPPRVWDRLGARGLHVSALFVPPSYPVTPVRGEMIGCFLTPSLDETWCYPPTLANELATQFGPYIIDVEGFREREPAAIATDIFAMTRQHFAIARHLWTTRSPDFLMLVEMGPDRLHHAFYRHMDPDHPRHDPDSEFVRVGADYYAALDKEVGELVALADDDTTILIVSDHGARVMHGGICINQWLMDKGYLVLHETPTTPTAVTPNMVDWSRTRAWGEGGYYARVFLNVAGREPQGTIAPADFVDQRRQLAAAIADIPCPASGPQAPHRVVTPDEAYERVNGIAPDLSVFFGDLAYRSIGSVGHGAWFVAHNDTGEDSCNHDWDGIFCLSGAGVEPRGKLDGCSIYDVAPTVLDHFGIPAPSDWRGVSQRTGRSNP